MYVGIGSDALALGDVQLVSQFSHLSSKSNYVCEAINTVINIKGGWNQVVHFAGPNKR